jgi:hypothetical protein
VAKAVVALHGRECFDDLGPLDAVLVVVAALAKVAAVVAASVKAVFGVDVVNSYFTFFRHVKFFRRQFAENFFITLI